MSDDQQAFVVRNEFAAVQLTVRQHGRGTRLEVSSGQLGTSALIDATILEALTRFSPTALADLVGVAMEASDTTVESLDDPDAAPAHTQVEEV